MSIVLRSPEAEDDLVAIWDWYSKKVSEAKADQMIDLICDVCDLLSSQPRMGKSYDELGEDVRSFPIRGYVLIYRPLEHGIELLSALHHSQDIPPIFRVRR